MKHNGMHVVSTFAGCGGSSEGWRDAGFKVAAAVEWDDHAAECYGLNKAEHTELIHGDVCEVTGERLLDEVERCTGGRQLHVFDGSPPCQSFSMAGSRDLMDDPRGELFSEYVGLVEEMEPRPLALVAENVAGLANGLARIPLYRIARQLERAGYRVHVKLLRAEWLGVPQARHRVIVLGFRSDLDLDPREWFPRPASRKATTADALPHVARIVRLGRASASHAEWREEESWPADRPAPTLSAGGLGNASWPYIRVETREGELRPPTVDELLALSTFRPDFRLTGKFEEQWARLGNSVPPAMMRAVAGRVAEALASAA